MSHGIEGSWNHSIVRVVVHAHTRGACSVFCEQLLGLEPAQPIDGCIPLSLLSRVAIALSHHIVVIEQDLDFGQLHSV